LQESSRGRSEAQTPGKQQRRIGTLKGCQEICDPFRVRKI